MINDIQILKHIKLDDFLTDTSATHHRTRVVQGLFRDWFGIKRFINSRIYFIDMEKDLDYMPNFWVNNTPLWMVILLLWLMIELVLLHSDIFQKINKCIMTKQSGTTYKALWTVGCNVNVESLSTIVIPPSHATFTKKS